ncbi:glucosamine-6-phosphate deaminase [Acuticoccus sp. M5D2P5]|uniref:glucosamine-6-phosphate deaminase n=1 Tax=Acuticoccus kalidii TaxID=2910977 RepID=UPI001F3D635D|nr:glucosamine-6-phosphate deaminase [Acuticoccus kalidii]
MIAVHRTAEEAEAAVTSVLIETIARKADAVLGLATGKTMIGIYHRLVRAHRHGGLPLARATTFNLDEYCDIAPDHPGAFRTYMRHHFFAKTNIDPSRIHFPAEGGEAAFERAIRIAGGIDLQLLGIGRNGHIGFNEPGSSLTSRTRKVHLTPMTREANAEDFGSLERTPTHAMTMGIATILDARRVILLATGAHKRHALADAVDGPVRAGNPASALQRHPNALIVCDSAAAAGIEV